MATRNQEPITIKSSASEQEKLAYEQICKQLQNRPIPSKEILANLALFLDRSALSHILFMHSLYRRIINVHGIVAEFGVRWGRNLALFTEFRNIDEPYNTTRKVVGFDTFEGFPSVSRPENRTLAPSFTATVR